MKPKVAENPLLGSSVNLMCGREANARNTLQCSKNTDFPSRLNISKKYEATCGLCGLNSAAMNTELFSFSKMIPAHLS